MCLGESFGQFDSKGRNTKDILERLGIVILLPNSSLLQRLYNVTAATLVQVKIPESVSPEETNDNVSATLTLAKATSVKRNNRDLTLHTQIL